jgi:hypothetical protein
VTNRDLSIPTPINALRKINQTMNIQGLRSPALRESSIRAGRDRQHNQKLSIMLSEKNKYSFLNNHEAKYINHLENMVEKIQSALKYDGMAYH